MKKKISALIMTAVLLFAMSPLALAAGSLSNFRKTETFLSGQFSDVSASHWAYSNIKSSYEYGLMNGQSATTFAPNGSLTVAATITVAARIHSIYYTGSENFVQGSPWYQCYVDYALENGLIDGEYANYDAAIQRWEFAKILGRALPDTALQSINTVEDGAIPDVPASASFSADVYRLYRAGILTGSGTDGKFSPYSGILRSEASAILSRMVEPGLRQQFTLTKAESSSMTAKQVYQKTQSSVFYIEIYNASGQATASGSGVFLTSSGVAVTNYHVIDGANSARIKTSDGTWYDVKGVYDYDEDVDLAVLQINGSGFTPAQMGDSRSVSTGDTVYALGNPLGLESTFSDGIVSNPNRVVQNMTYIQVTAPISSGSSGGALFDDQGRLIGITTGAFADGQNLNVAVPAYRIDELRQSGTVTALSTLFSSGSGSSGTEQAYKEYPDVPDIGAYCGMPLYDKYTETDVSIYLYRLSDAPNGAESLVTTHHSLLTDWGFAFYKQDYLSGVLCNLYYNGQSRVVAVGIMQYLNEKCYMVAVS